MMSEYLFIGFMNKRVRKKGFQQSSNLIGKVLKTAFQSVNAIRGQSEHDRTKHARKYTGLRLRKVEGQTEPNHNDLSVVVNYLLDDMFVMEKCEQHVVVGYKTKHICQGNHVIIELRICQNLEVQISVGSKSIKPSDFGIYLFIYCIYLMCIPSA